MVRLTRKRPATTAKDGECEVCAAEGMLPSKAIACALHSMFALDELRAEIAVLKDTAGGSSRLHLAIAEMNGAVPSVDGSEELASVRAARDRLDRVALALQYALHLAEWDDDEAQKVAARLRDLEAL